ncbi:GroES-like protein [Fomes fomentarius]|nr:GroES-like protein [Fomes fomentarius]
MTLPSTMKALVIQENRTVALQDRPVPTIDDDEVLIKTGAVALNNVEWKLVAFIGIPGTILGVDLAGEIVQVGKNVTQRKVGERVATFVHGAHYADRGAFAEYVKASADLVWVLPETMAYEQAAAMTCGVWTTLQALFHEARLGLPGEPSPDVPTVERDEWVFVYGGSTSTGQYAIQLLRAAGYKVATTCSPRNFALVTALGANAVFDYHGPLAEVVQSIKAAAGDTVRSAIDCISIKESQQISQDVIAPGGGKVAILLPKVEIEERPDVQRIFLLLYTVLGRPFTMMMKEWPLAPSDKAQLVAFCKNMPRLVERGRLKPNLLKVWRGGLAAIPDGLQYMKEGKLSAEKIVYRL